MRYLIIGASAAGLNAVKSIRELDSCGEITVLSGDREIYSRCLLPELIGGDRTIRTIHFIPEDFFHQQHIEWRGGIKATSLLPEEKMVPASDGRNYPYDRLLIATGASSTFPPVEGLASCEGVYSLRNLEDALAIKQAADHAGKALVASFS